MKSLRPFRIKNFPLLLLTGIPGVLLAGNPLDKVGNPTATPIVAFSLRQLSSAYLGNAIIVRRSSDSHSQPIGYTAAGDLDTATLKSFVGSDTGYVTTWYDQSGNGLDASQDTTALQPFIMAGGTVNNQLPSMVQNRRRPLQSGQP